MEADIPVDPEQGYFRAMIEALRIKHKTRNERAADILCRLGDKVVPLLVREAIDPHIRPHHRVRILEVIVRIGEPLSLRNYQVLFILLAHPVARVQAKALMVLQVLNPERRPENAVSPIPIPKQKPR